MNRAKALTILGLSEGATRDQVVAARRSKLSEHHPDRGGDSALFHDVRTAADFLLQGQHVGDIFNDIFNDIAKRARA